MELSFALLMTLMAVVGWGFGDFFIQRLVRKMGDWETLFIVTLFGAIILSPFLWKDIPNIFSFQDKTFLILFGASFILFLAALLDFEALKKGKLSVVEPIWSLEIIISSALAFLILRESINLVQGIFMAFLIIGLVLVSLRSYHLEKRIWLEKGVFLAILSAIVMGAANFFIGFWARESGGLMMNWFLNAFMAVVCLIYLISSKKIRIMFKQARENKGALIGMCIFDNAAWIGFAIAMSIASIGITVALSESYIIIAVLLGMYINKEYIRVHQKIGMMLALISAIILAYISY